MTKFGVDAIGLSTTLESNKSLCLLVGGRVSASAKDLRGWKGSWC